MARPPLADLDVVMGAWLGLLAPLQQNICVPGWQLYDFQAALISHWLAAAAAVAAAAAAYACMLEPPSNMLAKLAPSWCVNDESQEEPASTRIVLLVYQQQNQVGQGCNQVLQ